MRRLHLIATIFLFVSTPVCASPITLVCTGELTFPGQNPAVIAGETALLDFENGTFKPPMYNPYPLLKVRDTEITFGSEAPTTSVWGVLDRVSGTLSMTVMKPAERQRIMAGGSAHVLAAMTAKCATAKRMF
jgi:hypothetical protein